MKYNISQGEPKISVVELSFGAYFWNHGLLFMVVYPASDMTIPEETIICLRLDKDEITYFSIHEMVTPEHRKLKLVFDEGGE